MKKGSIPLSKAHGLNPVMATCPRCGQTNGEIALLGRSNQYRCTSCSINFVAYPGRKNVCPRCGGGRDVTLLKRDISGSDSPLLGNICRPCQDDLTSLDSEVKAGGIRWQCDTCKYYGVIRADADYARQVRKEVPHVDWDHTGITLTPSECPHCRGENGEV